MKCPKCKGNIREVAVTIEGARQKAVSYRCEICDYIAFEEESTTKVLQELKAKETPLKITQKIIKLSEGRLGLYLNKHIIDSLGLRAGEKITVSVPDKEHIILKIEKDKAIA